VEKNYRVVRSTYKGKHSFMVIYISQDGIEHDEDSWVQGYSLEDIRATLKNMADALNKPAMEEKREMVEI